LNITGVQDLRAMERARDKILAGEHKKNKNTDGTINQDQVLQA
jgi:hypothetical protein